MDFNLLPNVLIIGAAKSGTTSLYEMLAQHKDVYASPKKEPWFFSSDNGFRRGGDWYQETFFANSKGYSVRMEASPPYLIFSEKVAPRIKEFYKEQPIKFIAIFRDPVLRAYSNYWHHVRLGHEQLSFSEAIRAEDARLKENWDTYYAQGKPRYGYFRGGLYATQLKSYLDNFRRDRFFFLLQEDLQNDSSNKVSQLLSFLEIDNSQTMKPLFKNEAIAPRNISLSKLYFWLQKIEAKHTSLSFITRRLRTKIRHNFAWAPFHYPPMEDDIKNELYARYVGEIDTLSSMIGRDLSHWHANNNSN